MKALFKNSIMPVYLILAFMVTSAFSLSCLLSGSHLNQPGREISFADQLLGSARFVMSDAMYIRADVFFHHGVPHYRQSAFTDHFQNLKNKVSPTAHQHLEGGNVKEIMPWLYLAMKTNPGDSTPYIVAAFWLAENLGRPDLALETLRDAQRNAPRDYRVYLAQGRFFLKTGDAERAARAFDITLRVWPGDNIEEEGQAVVDLAEALTYRGLIHEQNNETGAAVTAYRQVLELFPSRDGISNRLAALSDGAVTELSAEEVWGNMLSRLHHVCDHDHDDDCDHLGDSDHH